MRAFLLCAALAPSTVALVLQPALHRGRLPALAKLQPLAEAPRRSLVTCQAAATLGDDDAGAAPAEGDSSFTSTVFNTCKAALGSGVLALPAGVKMMGDVPAVLWPANALIVGISSMWFIGVILFLVFYVFGIAAVVLFSKNDPWHFKSLHISVGGLGHGLGLTHK